MSLAETFSHPITKWGAGLLGLAEPQDSYLWDSSPRYSYWEKTNIKQTLQARMGCRYWQEMLGVCSFCPPALDPLQRPAVVPLHPPHRRASPPSSTGCSTLQGCSGSARAMSFPRDKRYAKGAKPAPPDSLLVWGLRYSPVRSFYRSIFNLTCY